MPQKLFWLFISLLLLSCQDKMPEKRKPPVKNSNVFYEKAFVFLDKNEQDSAFLYLNKAKEVFQKKRDSFGIGKSLVNMALIQENTGDNFGSIETSLSAKKFLNENDKTQHAIIFCNYNNLGITSANLKNYTDALRFYTEARHFVADPIDKMMLDNNLAILYYHEKEYKKSINIYQKLIDSVGTNSPYYPKLLLNYSRSKWFLNPTFNPTKNYLLAEKLSENASDSWTKDAAYCYLSLYYLEKNTDSARMYAKKMLQISKELNYPEDQIEALQNLIKLSSIHISKKYFDSYTRIHDSLRNAQNKARNQFALIRFESEKTKSENLRLQKEKVLIEYKIILQRIVIWGIIIVTIILAIGAYLYMKRRRQRILLEASQKMQQQRLDLSKKIHDVVANGIYEVMISIQNHQDLPKDKILDKLERMYEKSRDLSYDKQDGEIYYERLSTLISSFDHHETQIIIIGNDADFWEKTTLEIRENMFLVIQELLVNMKKHSFATQLILRFVKERGNWSFHYIDNGVGLPNKYEEKNGFSNIRERLIEINAALTVNNNDNGLNIIVNWKE